MAVPSRRSDPWPWIILLVVLLFLVPGIFMMGTWGTGMMGGGTWVGTWGIVGMAGGAAVLVLVLVLLFWSTGHAPAPPPYPYPAYPAQPAPMESLTPIQILEARYARGEITRDEYLRMRQDLETRRP